MGKNLTFEEKAQEYKMKVKELGRKMKRDEEFCFSDNVKMYSWYDKYRAWAKAIRTEPKLTFKQEYRIMLLAEIDNLIYDLGNKKIGKKTLTFEEKVEEYKRKVKELGRQIRSTEGLCFSDGVDMKAWYFSGQAWVKSMAKIAILDEVTKHKIMLFSEIDAIIYDLGNKKIGKKALTFEQKVEEYKLKIAKIGPSLTRQKIDCFSDGTKACDWYDRYQNWVKTVHAESNLTFEQKYRMILLAEIDNLIYDLGKRYVGKASLTFEEKVEAYKNKIKELGRHILSTEQFYFSDGGNMGNWYFNTQSWVKKMAKSTALDYATMNRIILFAEIDDLIIQLENNKVKILST